MDKIFKNKRILVTGACGTVGSELIDQLINNDAYDPVEIIGIDNNESQMFFLDQRYIQISIAKFFILDIRDKDELNNKFSGIDIVFHCAALKHVIINERSPDQAIRTNIHGVQNVIEAANANNVEKVIFTSSDKAVNPTNVMGTTKLMGERLITAANSNKREGGPIFSSTRFGNVLGSSGSVVPIFRNQIAAGGPVTLTHRDMSRFIMSIEQSVKLVIDSAVYAQGGEVFVTKMPVVKIKDLALAMIEELSPFYDKKPGEIEIVEIGSKSGEKLYEELMNDEETRRAIELKEYFSVLPAFREIYGSISYDYDQIVSTDVSNPYISSIEKPLTIMEIKDFLRLNKLLFPTAT